MIKTDQVKIPIALLEKRADGVSGDEELLIEKNLIKNKIAKSLRINADEIEDIKVLRRSIDARDKSDILYVYNVAFSYRGDKKRLLDRHRSLTKYEPKVFFIGQKKCDKRIVVTGAGPAGLFCAYALCLSGNPPVLIERGRPVEERRRDVDRFWESGLLDTASNVQFGEGGAGAFSDGKLNTLIKDRDGSMRFVLKTLVKFGAPSDILYDYKPHIGTDILIDVIKNMRQELLRLGCEIRFSTKLSDVKIFDGGITDIEVETFDDTADRETIPCDALILACGHSARDTFNMLYSRHIPMQAKEFAVGFRIEHPRSFIDMHQFGKDHHKVLGAAPYKLATKLSSGRGVYSFCMCPGGYVVNSSSEEGRLVVNGMSYNGRDGINSNSAIVVSVGADEFDMTDPLSGIEYQRQLEERAYKLGGGKIPQQLYGDFLSGYEKKVREDLSSIGSFSSQNKGGAISADLTSLFSDDINAAFVEGMGEFDKKMRGFACREAILSGVESRTSSPVRIPRDESFQSAIRGLYPCGEGAGYAGGITSAAMDGLKVAKAVASS